MIRKRITGLVIGLLASYSMTALAAGSGAYRVEMSDARALAMGGAFVGVADSPAAVFYNPAGMFQLSGPQVSVSLALLEPKMHAQPASGQKTKMQQESFLLPTTAFVTRLSDKVSMGVGVTSFWGLGTNWAQDSFARYAATTNSIQNTDYLVSASYRVSDQLSVGLGVVIDNSKVNKEKKFHQAGNDGNFKLKGDNTSAGIQLSGFYKVDDKHQFGMQYSSAIHRKYKGKVRLDDINTAYWNAALGGPAFSGSSYVTDAEEKYTLPQSIDLGYSYKPNEKLILGVDILWMDWSCVKEERLSYPSENNPYTLAFLNDGNPVNRDWRSAVSLGLGGEYEMSDRFRLRAGYYYHQSPIQQDVWDPSLPDANSNSIAMGFGYDITRAVTFDLAYSAMFFDTRSIKNNVGDASGGGIDGKYSQWINLVLATANYKF